MALETDRRARGVDLDLRLDLLDDGRHLALVAPRDDYEGLDDPEQLGEVEDDGVDAELVVGAAHRRLDEGEGVGGRVADDLRRSLVAHRITPRAATAAANGAISASDPMIIQRVRSRWAAA